MLRSMCVYSLFLLLITIHFPFIELAKADDAKLKSLTSTSARSAVKDFQSSRRTLDRQYGDAVNRLSGTYIEHIKKIRTTLIAELDEARIAAAQEDKLDEAVRIRDAIKALENQDIEPPSVDSSSTIARIKELEQEVAALKKSLAATVKQEPDKPKVTIPKQAFEFGGHHYLFFRATATWHQAKKFCEQQAGHLVRIESPQENAFIRQLVHTSAAADVWIDGTDELQEGVWLFSNGQPVKFTNWMPGEPSNTDEGEHYASLSRKSGWLWNDIGAGKRWSFVCEWDE